MLDNERIGELMFCFDPLVVKLDEFKQVRMFEQFPWTLGITTSNLCPGGSDVLKKDIFLLEKDEQIFPSFKSIIWRDLSSYQRRKGIPTFNGRVSQFLLFFHWSPWALFYGGENVETARSDLKMVQSCKNSC